MAGKIEEALMKNPLHISLPLTALAALSLAACATPADTSDGDDAVASEYRTYNRLASEVYDCTISDGLRTTATATVQRSLSQRISDPSDRVFVQSVSLGEPVFAAAKASLGGTRDLRIARSAGRLAAREPVERSREEATHRDRKRE